MKMRENESKRTVSGDTMTMYRATRTTTYRNKSQIINEVSDEALFTSKSKAVDRLRRDAEERLWGAVKRHERYVEGRALCFTDYSVALSEYVESEGALVLRGTKVFVELREGKLADNRNDPYFETF